MDGEGSEGHIYEDFPFNCPFLFLLLLIYRFSSFLFKKEDRERERSLAANQQHQLTKRAVSKGDVGPSDEVETGRYYSRRCVERDAMTHTRPRRVLLHLMGKASDGSGAISINQEYQLNERERERERVTTSSRRVVSLSNELGIFM